MNPEKNFSIVLCLLLLILVVGAGFRLAVMSQSVVVTQSGYSSYLKSTLNYIHGNETISEGEGEWRDSRELFEKLYRLEGGEISFSRLYGQLRTSNHPPLYYCLLHALTGFSGSGESSMEIGFLINLASSLLSITLVFLLGLSLFRDRILALFAAFLAASGFLTMETFVVHKAYELQVTFVLLVLLVVLRSFEKKKLGSADFVLYGTGCLLAFLSHYYSYLYIAGICLIIFVQYAWFRRDMKRLLLFGAATCASVAAAFLIYPYAVRDLLTDRRSVQIQEILGSVGDSFNNKIYHEIWMFRAWFLTVPHVMIIASAVLLVIAALVVKKQDFKLSLFFTNKKYILVAAYFAVFYCVLVYISPFLNPRYIAPLPFIFVLLLAGILQYVPEGWRIKCVSVFSLFVLGFNLYGLANVAGDRIPGNELIMNWVTRSSLEQSSGDVSVIVVSNRPKERILSVLYHAPPRPVAFCSRRIPEKLLEHDGEVLVLIDNLLSPKTTGKLLETVGAHEFELFGSYPGYLSYHKVAVNRK